MKAECMDCNLPYGTPKFCDLIIGHAAWKIIAPDDGLLCANCILGRLTAEGLKGVPSVWASGPLCVDGDKPSRIGRLPKFRSK